MSNQYKSQGKSRIPIQIPIPTETEREWLDVMKIQAVTRLSYKAALRWVHRYVPPHLIEKRGHRLVVHITGLNIALDKNVWRPKARKGYQGHPGRKPVNVNCRDELGRFVSHRPPGERPPARKRIPPWTRDRRARYMTP